MTLIYESDLDILKMHMHAKNEVTGSGVSKVRPRTGEKDIKTDTQTDRRDRTHYYPQSPVVIENISTIKTNKRHKSITRYS